MPQGPGSHERMSENPPRDEGKTAKGRRCPLCGKEAAADFRPFCSPRCRDVDLYRWLAGHYRVETDEAPEVTESPPPGEPGE